MTDDSEVRIAQLEARVQQLESDLDRLRARVDHAALSALLDLAAAGNPARITVAAPWAFAILAGTLDLDRDAVVGAVAIAVAGWQTGHTQARQVGAAVGLGLVLVWLGSVLVHLPQGQAAVSVSWATVGTAVLVAGAVKKVPGLGAAGLAVLGFLLPRLTGAADDHLGGPISQE